MASVPTTAEGMSPLIRWRDLWWVAAALAVMVAAIWSEDAWFLNFVHVFAGLLWTGIDLFMGFVLGPILRHLDLPARRAITLRMMPRMLFLMPTLAAITGTAGWYLADQFGYLDLPWPQKGWVVAALVIIAVLTVQGLGILLPTNVRVCLELQQPAPDLEKIGRWMRRYLRAVAFQGAMQVAIIVIMAKFATGI
ncbi:MAG TPA: hypothetical protein VMH36_00230 [Alphaproteobacteria bacterium]|nr:hypothetical protein [Alphaproteobacteria bacterium]